MKHITGNTKIKEEIRRYSSQYSSGLSAHPNDLVVNLMELPDNRRLRRYLPNDLPTRFLVQLLYLDMVCRRHTSNRRINEALENKQCCSAAFSDISQAFDKV
jgi:hypothetical protein